MPQTQDTLIVLGAGMLQVPVITEAKRLGYRVAATDRNPEAIAFPLADIKLVVSTKDISASVEAARELAQREHVVGVLACAIDVEVTQAAMTHAFGLPGVSREAAYVCNNKVKMRERFEQAGIPGPRYRHVMSVADIRAFIDEVGLPVIIKAIDNSGSRGARKIATPGDLAVLDQALAEAQENSTDRTALVEEFLVGEEQSVETIVDDGTIYRCNIVDRPFVRDPFLIELGHINPTHLSPAEQEALYAMVERGTRALGITIGAAKADTIWTKRGPLIIEMTARLSGGFHSSYTSPLAYGTNDIKAVIDLAVGKHVDPVDVTPKVHRTAVCQSVFPKPGRVVAIRGLEETEALPGVAKVVMLVKEGDVIEPYENCVRRVCYMIASADERAEAFATIKRALSTLQIVTESAGEDDRKAAGISIPDSIFV